MAPESPVDVEKLSEVTHMPLAEKKSNCSVEALEQCEPANCRLRCSLSVIDELLSTPDAVSGDDVDLLLDFRHLLRAREDAEATLRLFCELRRRLEQRHYLAFYRLRRWLENHVTANISVCQAAPPVRMPVKLNFYCVEAIRRLCLCTAMQQGVALLAPRLRFSFAPVVAVTAQIASHEAVAA
jgi:hypothetical protein